MTRPVGLVAALLCLAMPGPLALASAREAKRATPAASLHTYLIDDDYPAEAIRNWERGTVAFRLTIGIDGRPTDCAVTSSSGSVSLDATSCRIMIERARFRPATDASGKPVQDSFESRISWRIPEDGNPQHVEIPAA